MRRLPALALVLAAVCGAAASQSAAEFRNYYGGKRYDFRLTSKQLLGTPEWLESDPNPPLSPGLAKISALSYLRILFDNAREWQLAEIKLVPLDRRWVYVVSFTPPPPPGCQDCMVMPFNIVVLMDGNAAQAEIRPAPIRTAK